MAGCSYNEDERASKAEAPKMQDGKIVMPGRSSIQGPISEVMKKRVDQWIQENNLNEYGDPKTTQYLGGTPLFDEFTGTQRDRYEYILENHPELGTP